MKRALVTHHAAIRGMQRLCCQDLRHASAELGLRWSRSVLLPQRHARQLLGKRPRRRRPSDARVRISGSTLLICRGSRVITTWKLDDDQLATVVWWTLTHTWCPGGAGARSATERQGGRP